jgi:hypothetical protein
MRLAAIGCIGLAAAAARPTQARAQSASNAEVNYTIKPPAADNSKTKGEAPQIEATVIGAPDVPAGKLVLVDTSVTPPVQIKAASKRSYSQGTETLALAIVMLGWEMWIGNDTYRPKADQTRTPGMLVPLKAALDKLDLKAAAPPGSAGMLITYDSTARIRVPLGPLGNLNGRALGTQKDYQNTAGTELVKGIELALAELRKAAHPRKMLIILTDGNDTNNEAAKGQLQTLKKHALSDRVEVAVIVYKAADSVPGNVASNLPSQTVAKADAIGAALQTALQRLADRQYVTFPGFDKAAKRGLLWDGKAHELVLEIDGKATDSVPVMLAPKWDPPGAAPAGPPARR